MSIVADQEGPATTAQPRTGMHYAWVIVGVLCLVQIIGYSISMAAGVVVIPLRDPEGDFGWSMAIIGTALMTYYLVGALFAPVSGWLGDRYGARPLLLVAGVLFGGSMALVGVINSPWQFFLTFGFLLASTQSICQVPMFAAVSWWFHRRLGVGVGLILGAGGIGAAALTPLMGFMIEAAGWRTAFWTVGAVGGGSLILLWTVFRNKPADMGLKPYGTVDDGAPEAVVGRSVEKLRAKVFNQHIRRTKAFWNLPVLHGLGCAGHGIIVIFASYIAFDRGASYIQALMILSIIAVCSIASRFITPVLAERYGGKPVMALALLVQGLTVLVLLWAHDLWAFYLFAVLFGMGFGGEMSAYLVVNRQYFGEGPISTCYGFQMMGALIGHAVATGLAGFILFATDSYTVILLLSIGFSLAGVGVIATLEPTSQVLIPDWEQSLPPEARSREAITPLLLPHLPD